jgi:V-type H+-transporting ATPase subunit a
MFGDIMHGIMLITGATVCIINAERWRNTSLEGFVMARYLLLLMGVCATFAGFCYNDMTSIPLRIFGESCYEQVNGEGELKPDCVYPIGVDPIWYMSANELTYMNSLKMKMSVIFGVGQMSMGVCIKALNAVYFNRKLELIFEFIPQIVLLMVLFGFMDLMIISKWLIDWENLKGGDPPSIVSQMIDMTIKGGVLTGSELVPNQVIVM